MEKGYDIKRNMANAMRYKNEWIDRKLEDIEFTRLRRIIIISQDTK